MAENITSGQMTKEFEKMTKAMVDAIKGKSQMDMFPSTSDEKINDSMDRTLNDILKKIDDFQKKDLLLSKKQLALANKTLKEKGLGDGKASAKDLALQIDQAKAMRMLARRLKEFDGKVYDSQEELDEELKALEEIAAKANMSIGELGITTSKSNTVHGKQVVIVKNANKTYKKLDKTSADVLEAFEEISEEAEDVANKMNKSSTIWGKIGDAVKFVTADFIKLVEEERRYAQQTATADAGWIKGLTSMSISTLEYMKILKDTRIENLAMTSSGRDFTKSLIESQKSLVGFTKDSTEAAEVAASFHKSMSRIGVSQDQLGDAVQQQSKIYKENYRVLGYTADEFSKLSDELINTQGMRSVLLGLQEKERKQYVLGIQQRMAEYQTMGYTIERAKELQATFQALNGMNPKERMKQAAKTRAMMGALGMGQEGEELFKLQTTYRTMDDTQKLAADKRMTEIQGKAASTFGEKSGSGTGLGQSMSFQMLADKTGFTQIAEKFETASGEGIKIDKEQLEIMKAQAKSTNEVDGTIKKILGNMDTYSAAERTAVGSIGTNMQKGLFDLGAANALGFGVLATGVGGLLDFFTGDKEKDDGDSWFSGIGDWFSRGSGVKSTGGRSGAANRRNKNASPVASDVPVSKTAAITPVDTVADTTIVQADGTVTPTTASSPKKAETENAELNASKKQFEVMTSALREQSAAMNNMVGAQTKIADSYNASAVEMQKQNKRNNINSNRGTGL